MSVRARWYQHFSVVEAGANVGFLNNAVKVSISTNASIHNWL
jgi:hypothetical protein